ncbi:unnamed protein product [Porites evermanni]|uniref:DNA-directed DNA polymerase n=1 Tax=Porites evermanni TaxID=104178 RepID=A0ABN8PHZ3_9CNID|nr:unnamed protein product [Porites evermanni]
MALTEALHQAIETELDREQRPAHHFVNFAITAHGFTHAYQTANFTVGEFLQRTARLDEMLATLAGKLNSNEAFNPNRGFQVDVVFVSMPGPGSGYRYPVEQRQAQELHREAGVAEGPCGLPELRQFQQALGSQYQLLVMTRMKPFFLVFKGPAAPHQIRLLKSNDHFDGCTSFPAFVNRSYYCVNCERGFKTNDRTNHTCQGNRCRACGRFDCQDYVRGTRPTDYCNLCHCKFYEGYCKRHHVVTKQCQSVKTCLKCQAQYTVVPDRRHKCGHAKCPVCQEWASIQDHKCYIQPVVEDEEPEPTEEGGGCIVAPSPPLFVYADLEAVQNAEGVFVANLLCYSSSEEATIHVLDGEDFALQFLHDLDDLTEVPDRDDEREILVYCKSDVALLKAGCEAFQQEFERRAGFNPMAKCITIASACNLYWRKHHLTPDTIAVEPLGGWRGAKVNQSLKALQWLYYQEHLIPKQGASAHRIRHVRNGGEQSVQTIMNSYFVDGYDPLTRTVYEFHGYLYHGCPRCYPNRSVKHYAVPDRSVEELYQATLSKRMALLRAGYTVIEMWECEWDCLVDNGPAVSQFLRSFDLVAPLEPREAFFGGRTGAVALHAVAGEGEEIRYVDVTSVYPWVNKNCPYPIGHPQIITQPVDQSLGSYFGIATVDIRPPAGLFHPVLPVRSGQKLTFPLCRTCVQEEQAKPMLTRTHYCHHSDANRTLRGTWCTPDLVKAVEKGYTLAKIHEVWHFPPEQRRTGLFADYVNTWLKLKQESAGWPSWCQTLEQKRDVSTNPPPSPSRTPPICSVSSPMPPSLLALSASVPTTSWRLFTPVYKTMPSKGPKPTSS